MARDTNDGAAQKAHSVSRVKQSGFRHHLFIESYGVKIGIAGSAPDDLETLRRTLSEYVPQHFRKIEKSDVEHRFAFFRNADGKYSFYKADEQIFSGFEPKSSFEIAASEIRRTIAEFAVGRVFIHAGAVGWKDKAILIPGRSFSGKTSLTAALVKRGALYYSDEYAVLDEDGFLHPFPKTLSIRGEIDDQTQIEYPVESLGGTAGTEKIKVGMVLIAKYKPYARWQPKILTPAQGVMEIIKNTVSIRTAPDFALDVFKKIVKEALIVKSNRGDAAKFADLILDFFSDNCFGNE